MEKYKIPKTERDSNTFFTKEKRKTVALLRDRYNLSHESAEDVYQDSCIALFQNIKNGKLVSLTSSLSTYFTQICILQTL
jgi:DNA-directed RNA polymerase specialized sigma24 family protein